MHRILAVSVALLSLVGCFSADSCPQTGAVTVELSVVNVDGEPISGASVHAELIEIADEGPVERSCAAVTEESDAEVPGEYVCFDAVGIVRVTAYAPGYVEQHDDVFVPKDASDACVAGGVGSLVITLERGAP